MKRRYCFGLILLVFAWTRSFAATSITIEGRESSLSPRLPIAGYEKRTIEGWTVFVSDQLLQKESGATSRALGLLQKHLEDLVRVVPPPALVRLRTVPLYVSSAYPGVRPRAEYHPAAEWLRKNGRDPAMAKGIEFTNIPIFAEETCRMPVFVLHELAHSYHDQVLGFNNPEIKATYRRAVDSKSYDAVERFFGNPAKKNTIERAYAMKDAKEYFAETTEALFGRNDFYPFNCAELKKHDPEMYRLLRRLWQCDAADAPSMNGTKNLDANGDFAERSRRRMLPRSLTDGERKKVEERR